MRSANFISVSQAPRIETRRFDFNNKLAAESFLRTFALKLGFAWSAIQEDFDSFWIEVAAKDFDIAVLDARYSSMLDNRRSA